MATSTSTDGVYRVIDVVGSSSTSWEEAAAHAVEHPEVDLRLVAPVGLELLLLEAELLGDLLDRLENRFLCDLEAALHDGSMVVSG